MKKLTTIAAGIVLATGLAGGLAACGTSAPAAPVAAVTVTAVPTPTVTKTVVPTPTPTVTKTVTPKVIYAQAPAAPALTDCGGGLYAGVDTSCPFALDVEESWSGSSGNPVAAYSPVTGLWYDMNCVNTGTFEITCSGGDNAVVEFSF
jgi:hypothetical protein